MSELVDDIVSKLVDIDEKLDLLNKTQRTAVKEKLHAEAINIEMPWGSFSLLATQDGNYVLSVHAVLSTKPPKPKGVA